jgi:hypothetical protein
MIKSNELRLGNVVAYRHAEKTEPTIHRVIRLERITARLDKCPEGDLHMYSDREYSDIEGVPLTGEWLETCGWQLVDQGRGPYYWLEKQCWFHIHLSEDSSIYANFNNNAVPIRYLHQLQNLYFALTGEELTIKETV